MKTQIYIATHKKFEVPKLSGYIPLEVGSALRNLECNYIKDLEGDSISEKNATFCELTGLYWIWKNTSDDIVSFCHYRRYFSKSRVSANSSLFITVSEIEKNLSSYDIILPEKWIWKTHTVSTGYYEVGKGFEKDLITIRGIIQNHCPDYLDSFDKILNGNSASYCNMFCMKKELLNKYCEWLFDILFEAERLIDISSYTEQEKRIFGYLSEILLNVWVEKNKLKVYFSPMVNMGRNYGKRYKLADMSVVFRNYTKRLNYLK